MSAPELITLVDPEGNEVLVSEPADINNLVFGQGYKVKGKTSPEQALTKLAVNPERAAEEAKLSAPAAPAVITTTTA